MVFVHDVKSAILVGFQGQELPLKRIQPRLLCPALVLFPEKFNSSQFPQPGSPSNRQDVGQHQLLPVNSNLIDYLGWLRALGQSFGFLEIHICLSELHNCIWPEHLSHRPVSRYWLQYKVYYLCPQCTRMLGRFEKTKAFVLMISPGFDDEKACRVAFFGPLRKLIGSFHLQSICWQLQLERQTKQ